MPRDLQHILGKSYVAEKMQDTQNRAGENRQFIANELMKDEVEKREKTVAESEESEGKTVNADDRKKQEQEKERKKKRERSKEIARRLERDTGHNVDLEA